MEKNPTSARFYPVKLSMEISYTTHSHIIGRGGTNINQVMQETSTKIHFPDQNRVIGEKKSNEVTIAGDLINVDTARRRLRTLTPVEYIVECPTEVLAVYDHAALIKHFAAAYDVLLRVNDKSNGSTTNVTLRGSHKELFRLKEAVFHFMKITGKQVPQVAAKMEVGNDCMSVMEAHVSMIESQYSVTINFTPVGSLQYEDLRIVWIRGSIDTVYLAKNALTELLPFKLMFHVHAIHLAFGVNERKLAKRLDVAVKMESSTKPNSFLLQISSYEKNAGNVYEFRRQILRLPSLHVSGFAHPCPPRLQDVNDNAFASVMKPHSPRFREVFDSTSPNSPPKNGVDFLSPTLPASTNAFPLASVKNLPVASGVLGPSLYTFKFDRNSYVRLCELLAEADLTEYCHLFLVNEVDLSMFITLGDEDLKNIGVSSYLARRNMLQIISEFHSKSVAKGFGILYGAQ